MKGVKGIELVVCLEDKAGALGKVTAVLAQENINIRAVSGWIQDGKACIRLIVSDSQKAKQALEPAFEVKENEVVIAEVTNEVGQLDQLSSKVSQAGINLTHIYGTTCCQEATAIVFASDNNDKALQVISA